MSCAQPQLNNITNVLAIFVFMSHIDTDYSFKIIYQPEKEKEKEKEIQEFTTLHSCDNLERICNGSPTLFNLPNTLRGGDSSRFDSFECQVQVDFINFTFQRRSSSDTHNTERFDMKKMILNFH